MMKRSKMMLPLCAMLSLATSLYAQSSQTFWIKTYGGNDRDVGRSIVQTSEGDFVAVGRTASFGSGGYDVWLLRINESGDTLWARTYGDTNNSYGIDVKQTSDGGFIITGARSAPGNANDVLLIRTDATGGTLWTQTYGGIQNDAGYSIQQTYDEGFIIGGYTRSFGAIDADFWLIRTNELGDTLWTRTYGGDNNDFCNSVAQTTDGGFIATGRTASFGPVPSVQNLWLIRTNELGDTLWSRVYGGDGQDHGQYVKETADSGFIITGSYYTGGGRGSDIWLLKTDSSGDIIWTHTYDNNDDWGYSVDQTFDGGFIVIGDSYHYEPPGGNDMYLIRTDASGDTLWTRIHEGQDVWTLAGQQTTDGGYIITGDVRPYGAGASSFDLFVMKTDSLGQSRMKGDLNNDWLLDILDVLTVVNIILDRNGPYSYYDLWAADMNNDEEINIFDIITLIIHVLEY